MASKYRLPFRARAATHPNLVARRLFQIADTKRTNLILSPEFKDSESLLRCADLLGASIVAIQVNSAQIPNFSNTTIKVLKDLATQHNFLICETYHERKGPLRVENWADIIVATPGDALTKLLKTISAPDFPWSGNRAIVVAPELKGKRAAALGYFSQSCVEDARDNSATVMGFIAPQGAYNTNRERQHSGIGGPSEDEDFVHLTTIGPEHAPQVIAHDRLVYFPLAHGAVKAGSDFVVLGHIICGAMDRLAAIRQCRAEAWGAYEERLPLVKSVWVKKWETWVKRPGFGEAEVQQRGQGVSGKFVNGRSCEYFGNGV
ncbi:orotidine 5'-monophosphate decarboxylase [Plectosphaerella plurivora]|uniref:Orotidine 5'-monophosphate decarboxylase n=1 Tax=Plectosphaerella plurivora TaxID=936078 RepID=A0A9P9AAQ4_9PEZI|nr:orotidine 5'-monophosphate decarboxylase [Plectosphaerella plurivora]